MATGDPRYRTPQWRRLRPVVFERDGWRCRIRLPGCTGYAEELDHIVRPEVGGAFFDSANLRAACRWCNRSRGGKVGAAVTNARRYPPALEW